MSAPSDTGRFWICPECKRHVPDRKDACLCGFDRTTVPVKMREVSAREPTAPQQSPSFLRVAWPVVLIAGLVGYIAYDRLSRSSANPSQGSPTPTITVVAAVPRAAPAVDVQIRQEPNDVRIRQEPNVDQQQPGAERHVQVLRVEVPEQSAAPEAPSGRNAQQASEEAERRRQQAERDWQSATFRVISDLRTTKESYRVQLCSEFRSGIPISNTRDSRSDYVAARNAAIAHEDVPAWREPSRGRRRIPWDEFASTS